MKYALAIIFFVIVSFSAKTASVHPQVQAPTAAPPGSRTPIVLELFTSEGCSSCPPADALLAQLQELQPIQGAEIITLEEHVDYWDSQGWRDPYSSFKWTARQQEYADVFKNGSTYTPQMVIDGHTEFVGSKEGQAKKELVQAARDVKTAVKITQGTGGTAEALQLTIQTGRLTGETVGDSAEIWVAVTESNLQSSVTRGENAGAVLRHSSVLRSLAKIGKAESGKDQAFAGNQRVKLDGSWKRDNTSIVVFIQEHKSRKILGAASLALAS